MYTLSCEFVLVTLTTFMRQLCMCSTANLKVFVCS